MTFNPAAAQTVIQYIQPLGLKTVLEFGNQRYTANRIVEANSTKEFYLSRGFDEYTALDVNDEMDAVIVDLNDPETIYKAIDFGKLLAEYDLVTNIGTTEHIFNQYSCFRIAHDLCREGGFIYHQLPFTPWVNHGLYNYNPIFFDALAYANDYRLDKFVLCDREFNTLEIPYEELMKEKRPDMLEFGVFKMNANVLCNVIFQKVRNSPFKIPFQLKYRNDIKSKDLKNKYA